MISIVVDDKKEGKPHPSASIIQDLDSNDVGGQAIPNGDQHRPIASDGRIVHLPANKIPFNEVPRVTVYLQSPSPIRISIGLDPKPFERFVHLRGYPQLVNLRRRGNCIL
jgi:hypothetical protein